jgi:hypothetical protein
MRIGWILLRVAPLMMLQTATAHHLDEYDSRIRAEVKLPAKWFNCKSASDCELVSVPCQSNLAVNASHAAEAREAIIKEYPFCLGASLSDTRAVCDEHQCVTKPIKKP